jgi:hypothetical protein
MITSTILDSTLKFKEDGKEEEGSFLKFDF